MNKTAVDNRKEAEKFIASLPLDKVVTDSIKRHALRGSEHDLSKADADFRDLLLLQWIRINSGYSDPRIRPTPHAQAIWESYVLRTKEYRELCLQLFGSYLDYDPQALDKLGQPGQKNELVIK